jgi:protein phosphatase PTC7
MIKLIFLLLLCNQSIRCQTPPTNKIRHIIHPHPNEPDLNYSEYIFKGGVANQPKPEKEKTGGEDALIFSKNFMAVADGVGGWANQGIDSSKYSIALIQNVKDLFYTNSEHYSNKPKDLLVDAAIKNTEIGTSTLIVCTLWKKHLKVGFIGDSGYMLFKPQIKHIQRLNMNNIVYQTSVISEEQEHAFNFPFQIGTGGNDPKTQSLEFSHEVNIGDIVLVISDGVLDNLYPQEIEFYLNKYIQDNKMKYGFGFGDIILNFDGQAFADFLLEKTFARSLDKTFVSPFSSGSLTGGMVLQGGKSDDISIAVGMVMFPDKRMNILRKVDYTKNKLISAEF